MSTHINAANKNDIAESILLPGDPLRAKFIAENFLDSPKCYNEIRGMLGYTGTYRGVPVSVQGTGMGMPSMGIYSWELITEYGVQNLIRIGTAGSFHEDIKVRDIVVGMAASTDSNYIHAFDVPGNYAPCASFKLLSELEATSKQLDIPFKAGNIVSCDVFYELKMRTDTFSSQMPVKKSPRKPTNDMCSLRICSCGAEFLKKPPGKMPARSNTTSAMRPLNVSKNIWQIFSI